MGDYRNRSEPIAFVPLEIPCQAMFTNGTWHYHDEPPAHLEIYLYFDRPMDQTVTPEHTSWSLVTDRGPATSYNQIWVTATRLLIEANDLGGFPAWCNIELLIEDAGLRSTELVNCCPFGPTVLIQD